MLLHHEVVEGKSLVYCAQLLEDGKPKGAPTKLCQAELLTSGAEVIAA